MEAFVDFFFIFRLSDIFFSSPVLIVSPGGNGY